MLKKNSYKNILKKFLGAKKIAIIASEYNSSITDGMLSACVATLLKNHVSKKSLAIFRVPGAFEIPVTAKKIAERQKAHIIISLGAVIKGDTYHFELVAQECARGCQNVALQYGIPVIFEVLACYNISQAKKRSQKNLHNKGIEAAQTALKMLKTMESIK